MAQNSFSASLVTLFLLVIFAPLPSKILAIPVTEVVEKLMHSGGIPAILLGRLFALDGTKDISGVTILVPRFINTNKAGWDYARHDNSTRKFSQAVYDALSAMRDVGTWSPEWVVGQNINAAVAGTLSDIWRFQVVKQYIPPSVAVVKYVSGGPWELPTLEGEPIWLSYNPTRGSWNVSGMSPQQLASKPVPSTGTLCTPFAHTEVAARDLVADIPNGEVVVYASDSILFPYNMDALSAYAGATTSIVQLLALTSLALAALVLV